MVIVLASLAVTAGLGGMIVSLTRDIPGRRAARRILALAGNGTTVVDTRRSQVSGPLATRILAPALARLGATARRLTPAGVLDRISRQLTYAGSPIGWDAERVLAYKLLGSVALALLAAVGYDGYRRFGLGLLCGAIGFFLPDMLLRARGGKRQEEIRLGLADALDLLSITVEAGLGFDAALARVGKQVGGPLGDELHRVIQEIQLGRSRREALHLLSERTTVPEVRSFVLAMVQAEIFGISIGKVLHVQAKEMRTKRRQRAEERAQKVPVKILFPLLFCVFPSLFVVLLGPAAISIYRTLFTTI